MSDKLKFTSLKGRVAIITGSTRGIGKECAFALAKLGCNITIAAKTVDPQPTLPGTIFTVAREVEELGVEALAFQLDVRNPESCQACVAATVAKWGRVDIMINNASALWWKDIVDTPLSKYALITELNARGTFLMTQACLPHMEKNNWGHVINMSPPIDTRGLAGRTAYSISKFGMTLVALGVSQEYKGRGVAGNTLWPATVIESYASINFQMGTPELWRKASILSDCVCSIVSQHPDSMTGHQLIDDDYLRDHHGFQTEDFACYQCVPGCEPPLLLKGEGSLTGDADGDGQQSGKEAAAKRTMFERGLVKDVEGPGDIDRIRAKTMEGSKSKL